MGSALWAGISGLNASSKELDVIANNLANVNTIGFKAGTTYFADVLSQSISGGSSGTMQVGRGVSVSEVQTQFSAGSFETTGNSTDVAIDGDGFFMVNDDSGATFYTRAGAFRLNAAGLLVDTEGNKVQGKVVANGEPIGALDDINLSDVQSTPEVTTTFAVGANLNSATTTGGQYNTTQTVYDSLGAKHTLNTTFTKTEHNGTGYWGVQCFLDSDPVNSISSNGFTFDADGLCTGMYTGSNSAVTAAQNTVSAVTEVDIPPAATSSLVGTGAGPGLESDDNIVLTRTAAGGWTITQTPAATYGSMAITSANGADPVTIASDGTNNDISLDLSGTWETGNTATFDITGATVSAPAGGTGTATAALNRANTVSSAGTMNLTYTLATNTWDFAAPADKGGYAGATVTSGAGFPITISLGSGTTDLTLTQSAGGWLNGEVLSFDLTPSVVSAVAAVTTNPAPTAAASLDHPENITATGTMTLTRGATAANWSITANGGYTSANIISADATTVNVDLNGDNIADAHLTLTGTWADNDTATFTLTNAAADATSTATVTLDRPGMIYQTGTMTLTRGANAWSISNNGGYTNATVTSSGLTGPVTISLDGTGTNDVTLALDTAWTAGDTATFTLTNTANALNDITINYTNPPVSWNGATIGTAGNINWNLIGDNSLNITQYSTASVIRALTADGYASGNLKTLSISSDGRISGFFTNGQTSDLAELMLAQFSNPWGLKKMGANLFGETVASGSAIQNYPGQSGMGTLTPNTLEMSNTDIATEFIKMITAQKAYQASARVITTEDTIMQELMNLKR